MKAECLEYLNLVINTDRNLQLQLEVVVVYKL